MNIFDQHYKKYDAWYDRYLFAYQSELMVLKNVLPKAQRGLEIGVGTGRFAGPLNITLGIDSSHNMLEIARQRGVNARWGFGEDLPFPKDAFDYAVIIITICFANDPLKLLREAKRVIKNNGQLIIGMVDKNSQLGKFYMKKKSAFYRKAHFYKVQQVKKILQQLGFHQFSFYQTIFTLPDEMQSIERFRPGFGEGGFVVIKAKNKKEGQGAN